MTRLTPLPPLNNEPMHGSSGVSGRGRRQPVAEHRNIFIYIESGFPVSTFAFSVCVFGPEQHKRFLSEGRDKDPDVIFIGDCILQSLQNVEAWNAYFAPMHCLNFSINGDQTQHLLWRLHNGELENVRPRAIVLLAGTNNVPDHTADQISEGIVEIVRTVRDKLPDVYIVLLVSIPGFSCLV